MRLSFADSRPAAPPVAPPLASPLASPLPPTGPAIIAEAQAATAALPAGDGDYLRLKTQMHRRLIEAMNLAGLDRRPLEEISAEVAERVSGMLREDACGPSLSIPVSTELSARQQR